MEEFDAIDLREYLHILAKRWWIILLTFVLAVGASAIISYFILDPVYEAKTTLFVGKEQQSAQQTLQYNDIMLNQQLVKDYRVLAQSRVVTQAVIDKLKLPITAEQLGKTIQVNLQNDTRIIEMKVSNTNPELARDIANTLAQVFVKTAQDIIKVENIQVVDRAQVPTTSVKPRPMMNIAIAGVLAIMVSVFIILLLEYLDHTIKTPEDIEKHLGLTTIGTIPLMTAEDLE